MKTTTKQVTVYEASDGKEFLSLTECQQYEKHLCEIAEMEYFVVWSCPELTETGCFTEKPLSPSINTVTSPQRPSSMLGLSVGSAILAWAFKVTAYSAITAYPKSPKRTTSIPSTTRKAKNAYSSHKRMSRAFLQRLT